MEKGEIDMAKTTWFVNGSARIQAQVCMTPKILLYHKNLRFVLVSFLEEFLKVMSLPEQF